MSNKKTESQMLREARKLQEAARQKRRRLTRLVVVVSVIVAVAGAVVLGVRAATRPKPGVAYEIQGAAHIELGTAHPPYNSNPPTSGWHFFTPAGWGYYPASLPDEVVVHNLEHGGIWISYQDVKDTQLAEKLEALTRRFPTKVIVTPRPQNDSPIAVAAWGRLLKLDHYDEDQIVAFIYAFRNRGPEQVPDM